MYHRIKKALKHTLIGKAIIAFNPIILIPLYIDTWGGGVYGYWLLLLGGASYVSLFDFGLSHYFPNKLAILKNRKKIKAYTIYLNQIITFYLLYFVIVFFIIFFISYFVMYYGFFDLDFNILKKDESAILFFLFMLNNSIGALLDISSYMYIAHNDYYLINKRNNISKIFNTLISILILLNTSNPIYIVISWIVITVLVQVYSILDVSRRYDFLSTFKFTFSFRFVFSHLKNSIWFSGVKINNILTQTVPIFIINYFLGSHAIVVFNVHRTFINMAVQIKSLFDGLVWRESTILYSKSESELISWLYLFLQKNLSYFFLAVIFFCLTAGGYVFNIWMSDLLYRVDVVLLLLVMAYVTSLSKTAEIVMYARNETKSIIIIKILLYILLGTFVLCVNISNLIQVLILLLSMELVSCMLVLNKVHKNIRCSNLVFLKVILLFVVMSGTMMLLMGNLMFELLFLLFFSTSFVFSLLHDKKEWKEKLSISKSLNNE